MFYIMYMTQTLQEARRIGRMAKRIHAVPLPKCIAISGMDESDPIFREPQYGHPRVRVRWMIGTQNLQMIEDKYAWDRAIYLYENYPYWLACLISWLDHFRTKRGTRVLTKKQKDHVLHYQEWNRRKDEEEEEKHLRKEKELKEKTK